MNYPSVSESPAHSRPTMMSNTTPMMAKLRRQNPQFSKSMLPTVQGVSSAARR